jgi:hypothetical protein
VVQATEGAMMGLLLFATTYRLTLGPTQPPVQWIPRFLTPGLKLPGRETDHSPQSSAEVKNAWSCISNPQYVFMVWYLVKHRGTNLSLPFT